MADTVTLRATPGRELRAGCGCMLVEARERLIDGGVFVIIPTLVVVPCNDETHVSLMRWVATDDETGSLEEIMRRFEEERQR